MADCRELRWCARGVRRWLHRHGVPVEVFLEQGLSVEWLRATGDGFALQLADHVEARS